MYPISLDYSWFNHSFTEHKSVCLPYTTVRLGRFTFTSKRKGTQTYITVYLNGVRYRKFKPKYRVFVYAKCKSVVINDHRNEKTYIFTSRKMYSIRMPLHIITLEPMYRRENNIMFDVKNKLIVHARYVCDPSTCTIDELLCTYTILDLTGCIVDVQIANWW